MPTLGGSFSWLWALCSAYVAISWRLHWNERPAYPPIVYGSTSKLTQESPAGKFWPHRNTLSLCHQSFIFCGWSPMGPILLPSCAITLANSTRACFMCDIQLPIYTDVHLHVHYMCICMCKCTISIYFQCAQVYPYIYLQQFVYLYLKYMVQFCEYTLFITCALLAVRIICL